MWRNRFGRCLLKYISEWETGARALANSFVVHRVGIVKLENPEPEREVNYCIHDILLGKKGKGC